MTSKHTQQNINKLDFIRNKKFICFKNIIRKVKNDPKNGRKCFESIILVRDLYIKYIKNSIHNRKKPNNTVFLNKGIK